MSVTPELSASSPRGRRSTAVTIRDVASRANVSIATVSRVLRGHGSVTEATRSRVQRVVEELNFTPSRLGRSLAERQHAANGIVFPDLSGPYYAEVVLGYEAVASELDRSVLILSTHGRSAARDRVLDLAGRVDGIVILGRTVDDDVVREVASRGLPVVVVARPPVDVDPVTPDGRRKPIDSVNSENVRSGEELARHLAGVGVVRPLLVGDPEGSSDVAERWQGITDGFADVGVSDVGTVAAGFSEAEGRRVAEMLTTDGVWTVGRTTTSPDALVCANDELALGALDTLIAAGVEIPGQVVVTGWDDVMAARWAGLTTVAQPMRELGATAAHLLDARIRGQAGPAHHELLTTHLVARMTSDRHR